MEAKELRDMSAGDLTQKRDTLREEIGHLKLKRATSRLENPMKLKANQAGFGPRGNDSARKSAARAVGEVRQERLSMDSRGLRKERTGLVVSDRMQKTVVVSIERTVMHPTLQESFETAHQGQGARRKQSVPCRRSGADRRMPAAQPRQALACQQGDRAGAAGGAVRGDQRLDFAA